MIITTYCAAALFKIHTNEAIKGNPAWANLRIESNGCLPKDETRGAGLYAIHYKDHLLYVGQFRGTNVNSTDGDVCATRWAKHLGTLTLRDRRISFNGSVLEKMKAVEQSSILLADLICADPTTLTGDRGRVSSLNRAIFAAENWPAFSHIAGPRGLTDFVITYAKIEKGMPFSNSQIRTAIERAERNAISQLLPRCNAHVQHGAAKNMNRVDTAQVLNQALESSFRHLGQETPLVRQKMHVDLQPKADDEADLQADDAELMTAQETFNLSLSNSANAVQAIDEVVSSFDQIDDAYVWYTKTKKGDLRIRSSAGRRRFDNVAVVSWQPRLRRFQSEINLSVEHCIELGATTAASNHHGATLPTRASFDIPVANEALKRCLLGAADQIRRTPK
ncbi:hypothetical protein [Rhodoferax aquaticus]|uniref:Uncharacterized protein n=1 Tax=Rhodoferax aquaticus TaxID=2527691 RepID=A0A515ERQ1_9BURK|nr:hypothetical protein [Rhodoferax aquaticus]QDL55342.1 hypothetical protein EXZ61_14825 [Rhodoferax aquaticus]